MKKTKLWKRIAGWLLVFLLALQLPVNAFAGEWVDNTPYLSEENFTDEQDISEESDSSGDQTDVEEASDKFPEEIIESLNTLGRCKGKTSQKYNDSMKILKAKANNLEVTEDYNQKEQEKLAQEFGFSTVEELNAKMVRNEIRLMIKKFYVADYLIKHSK